MTSFWLSIEFVGAYLVLFFMPAGVIVLWRKRLAARGRSPLTRMLLRGPGETLRNELDDAFGEVLFYWGVIPVFPLMLYALHISQSYFGGEKETVFRIVVAVLSGVAIVGYMLYRLLKLLRKTNQLRLGYEGEVAIAQELNQLMRDGAYVFHDVPAEGFNIDHVVVGANGVFAVETKARMKPKRDKGTDDARVVFDGQRLVFPGWTETAPLEQATRQAKWLGQWLTKAVGEKVEAKPVLALPGWFVVLQAKSDVVIINGRNATTVFSQLSYGELSAEMVKRIAYQLEQRCRTVEPRHFQKRGKFTA